MTNDNKGVRYGVAHISLELNMPRDASEHEVSLALATAIASTLLRVAHDGVFSTAAMQATAALTSDALMHGPHKQTREQFLERAKLQSQLLSEVSEMEGHQARVLHVAQAAMQAMLGGEATVENMPARSATAH